MLDLLAQALAEMLLQAVWWMILWLVVCLISTPFILLYAAVLALRHQQRFSYAVADGYFAVSDIWGRWGF